MGGVTEVVLRGEDVFLTEPGVLTPLPWPDWRARIRSLEVDGVRADYVEYDPYRFQVPALEDREDGSARLMLVVILAGTSIGTIDDHDVVLTPKRAVLIDGRAAMDFQAPEPLKAVRLFVDEDHLPPDVLDRRTLPYALLKDSPLVAGCVGLITGLLQVANPRVEEQDAPAVGKPLVALQAALLDEALHQQIDEVDATAGAPRRMQIERYVEQHLTEPGLSVEQIATALGCSVRTVHAAFDTTQETVARHIRDRRVARAQVLLAVRRDPPHLPTVASRVGLRSVDQLARAFKATTGTTAHQWWSDHHISGRF